MSAKGTGAASPRLKAALARAADVGLATLAWPAAFWVRGDFDPAAVRVEAWDLVLAAAAAAVVFAAAGVHRATGRHLFLGDLARIGAAAVLLAATLTSLEFARDRGVELPRAVPPVYALLVAAALTGVRLARSALELWRASARALPPALDLAPVLLVGAGEEAGLAIRLLRRFAPAAVPIGILDDETRPGRSLEGVPVLGGVDELRPVIARLTVRGVRPRRILVTGREGADARAWERIGRIARTEQIPLDRLEDLLRLEAYAAGAEIAAPAEPPPARRAYFAVKRAMDVAAAALGLLFVAPLLGLAALAVRASLGPPVFFRQVRRGRGLVPFELVKLRTMRDPTGEENPRAVERARHHPLGRFLRRFKIDELPQLWNVLKGDMALVGPRPLVDRELAELPDRGRARAAMRPGLTGWAQVNGGQLLSLREKEALDLWYIAHASLRLDLLVLWRTLVMIVRGERVNEEEVARALRAREASPALEAVG
ncbi:MAG: sugar transferase [Geminicoccaceae bacterium]|nr:sugar transferase [Geminicoccaceae bacterium]